MRRVRVMALVGLVALVGVVSACGSSASSAKPTSPSTATSTSRAVGSSTLGPVTGRPTSWGDVTAEWKARAPRPFVEGPSAVAEDLAAAWRGGDTSTVGVIEVAAVRRGEPLVVTLRETGGAQRRALVTEVEVTLEGGDEGWVVTSARARDQCVEVDESKPTGCT